MFSLCSGRVLYCLSGVDVLEPTSAGLYLEQRLLDMRTGAPDWPPARMWGTPAVAWILDSVCSFASGFWSTVKRNRR